MFGCWYEIKLYSLRVAMVREFGVLIAIIAFSVTAAAGIRALTGGCCGSCCQQPEVEASSRE